MIDGKECFVFANAYRIVWNNGSDKKRRTLKKKEIMAGKTLQILKETGFYGGSIAQTTTSTIEDEDKKKAEKKAEEKRLKAAKKAEKEKLRKEKEAKKKSKLQLKQPKIKLKQILKKHLLLNNLEKLMNSTRQVL